ncbi:hypothetical protein F5888DRAFT_1088727 [Russula emetica]|nr:hypothetical protein F5888DRAFT_1088727 [Russula emetica]
MAPTLGYLSTPCPLPPPSPSISYAYYTLTKKTLENISKSLTPEFSGPRPYTCFQAVPINVYSPKLLCVASCNHEAPCQREFLVRSCRDNVLQVPLLSTRSPGAIADLRAAMYRTTLRVLGVSRLVNRLIALTQPFYAGVTFCPSFGGEGPQMSPPSRSCPEMAFPDLQAVSCLSPPILGANERLMPKGVFIALIALPLNFAFHR